jgi:hypothetical protein
MAIRDASVLFGRNMPQFNIAAMLPTPSLTLTSVAILIAVVAILRSAYYRYFHPLSKVPGTECPRGKRGDNIALSP